MYKNIEKAVLVINTYNFTNTIDPNSISLSANIVAKTSCSLNAPYVSTTSQYGTISGDLTSLTVNIDMKRLLGNWIEKYSVFRLKLSNITLNPVNTITNTYDYTTTSQNAIPETSVENYAAGQFKIAYDLILTGPKYSRNIQNGFLNTNSAVLTTKLWINTGSTNNGVTDEFVDFVYDGQDIVQWNFTWKASGGASLSFPFNAFTVNGAATSATCTYQYSLPNYSLRFEIFPVNFQKTINN